MDRLSEVSASLVGGFEYNCIIFFCTLIMAVPLGLVITFGSMSRFKPLKWVSKTFVWIIRGTPLMLQLFVVLYAPGLIFDIPIKSRMTAVLIAFVINYAAYFSEIYRGGIESIPKGQYEAGQVLGLTKPLARIIGVTEIIMCAERFTKQGLIWPLFSTGLFFLAFCGILTLLFGYIEKKLDYYKG